MTDRRLRPHLPTAASRLLGATVLAGGFLLAGAAHPALASAGTWGDHYDNNENSYNEDYDNEGEWPCPEDTTTTTEAPETTTTEAPETTTTVAPATTAAPTTVKVLDETTVAPTTAAPTTTVAAADPKVKQLALTGGSSAPLALAGGTMILAGSAALRRSARRDED